MTEWMKEAYEKYGKEIASKGLTRTGVMALTKLGESRSRRLLDYVRLTNPHDSTAHKPTVQEPTPVYNPIEIKKPEIKKPENPVNAKTSPTMNHALEHYYYDQTTDIYITFLKSGHLKVSGHAHRGLKQAYSNWDGKPETINTLCREYQIPRAYLTQYIRIHGWTHDSEPFSDEAVATTPVEVLVNDALLQRKHQLAKQYNAAQYQEIEMDAQKWRDIEQGVLPAIEKSITAQRHPIERLKLREANRAYSVVIAPQDFHWGGYGWIDETGETYNRVEAERRIVSKTEELASLLPGRPEKIYVSVGGDWFHTDGDHASTTKGTPMEADGSPSEILITGMEMARKHIDSLRQIAPVELVFMGGNHDRSNSLALLMYLSAWYRHDNDVTIHRTPKLRSYISYRDTLIGFTHGDKVKAKDLGHLMANEASEQWGQSKSRIWFTGHLHHEVVREIGGIVQYQLPSLSGTDRWHARQGFTTARAGICAHLIGESGVFMSLFAQV